MQLTTKNSWLPAQIFAPCEFHPMGLTMREGTTEEELTDVAEALGKMRESLDYFLADTLRYSANVSGDTAIAVAKKMRITRAEADKLLHIADVPKEERRRELTPAHHAVVSRAKLSVADTQKWLQIAIDESLSVHDLAASIEAGEIVHADDEAGGISTATNVVREFTKWRKSAFGTTPVERWPSAAAKAVLAQLEPVAKLIEELKTRVKSTDLFQ